MLFKSNKKKGFTLIEIVIVLAIFGILSTTLVATLKNLKQSNKIETTMILVEESVFRAKILSIGQYQDDGWGVNFSTGEIIVFKGNSFAGRDQGFDEIIGVSSDVTFTNTTEFIFDAFTGEPQSTGIVTINLDGDSKDLSVNEKGQISF